VNIYIYVFAAVAILILLGSMIRGWNKGFIYELRAVLSLAAALAAVMVIASLRGTGGISHSTDYLTGIILLIVLGVVYKIIHAILTSIHLFARLPLIRTVDSVLGLALGFVEGFFYLYILEYALVNFILA